MGRMIKKIVFILMLNFSFFSFAQMTYREVDSTSYALYLKKDWLSLIQFGEKAAKEGNDFFYFNLRVGIAYFNFQEYKNSKAFLEKANHNNSYNLLTKEYLFWCNYYLLNEKEAKQWYQQLDDSTRQQINYQPEKFISNIYLEGGQKLPTQRDIAKTVNYFNLSTKFHLTGKLDITTGYTYIQQNLNWGDFTQHQAYINPSYHFNRTLSFNVGFQFANYQSQLNYSREDFYQTPPPMGFPGGIIIDSNVHANYDIQGSYLENDFYFQPRITKHWDLLSLSPFVTYYASSQEPNYQEHFIDTIIITQRIGGTIISQTTEYKDSLSNPENELVSQFGIGTGIYLYANKLTIGAELEYINRDNTSFFFLSPFVKIELSKKLNLSAYFFKKKNYTASLFQASQLINSLDNVTKFSATTNYQINSKIGLYFTYQFENITDRLSTDKYKLNSFYLGLKLKF